jgi:hypothetical protein
VIFVLFCKHVLGNGGQGLAAIRFVRVLDALFQVSLVLRFASN